MQEIIRRLLAELVQDPSRDGLLETPRRVEQSLRFLTSGYRTDIDSAPAVSVTALPAAAPVAHRFIAGPATSFEMTPAFAKRVADNLAHVLERREVEWRGRRYDAAGTRFGAGR